jgi:hypothetical protein
VHERGAEWTRWSAVQLQYFHAVQCAVLWWEDVGHHGSATAVVLGLTGGLVATNSGVCDSHAM